MRTSRIGWLSRLVCGMCTLCCLVVASPAFAQSTETVESFRAKYSVVLDRYEQLLQRMGSAKGLKLVNEARKSLQEVTNDQLVTVFAKGGVPNLSEMVTTLDILSAASRAAAPDQLLAAGAAPAINPADAVSPVDRPVAQKSAGFPDAPPVIADCNNIIHDASFRFGFLIALQIANTLLRAAEFVCEQDVLGENVAAPCIILAVAVDVATIPYELSTWCAGEDDGALIQGSFDRLEHIHGDLEAAQTAIISNANANTTTIINNDNANKTAIINNDNANKTAIINNDNANRDLLINELHALGCDIVRLLNTPEGQRSSSILACTGQPGFPYNFPQKKD